MNVDGDKPLPPTPSQHDVDSTTPTSERRPSLRPQISSLQPFQRPKKRVVWKGKSCIIAVPLDDNRGSQGFELLTPANIRARIHQWEQQGYDTEGFTLGGFGKHESSFGPGGQSRAVFPDQNELGEEHLNRGARVSIPDRAQWDAYVNQLNEAKLRALGVTTGNADMSRPTQSPLSALMSQTSFQRLHLPVSPPQPPSSAASNQIIPAPQLFSPNLNPSTGLSSQAPSVSPPSSQYAASGSIHHVKSTAALPAMEARITSPFNYSALQPTPPMMRDRSAPQYFAQRGGSVSPPTVGGMQSLGAVLSPVSPFVVDDPGRISQPNFMLDQMRQQQQDILRQHQQQEQMILNLSRNGLGLPKTPHLEAPPGPAMHIASPAPRSHRRNVSEALQREIDEAENLLSKEDPDRDVHLDQSGAFTDDVDTNPSRPGSPTLAAKDQSQSPWTEPARSSHISPVGGDRHKVKPSTSKLNVEAKEFKFDPKAAFASSNFIFGSSDFQPIRGPAHLNAAAPEFQPSTSKKPVQPENAFQFSSATFNVDAPVFNPSKSLPSTFGSSVHSESDQANSTEGKIFGDVQIDLSGKAVRRSTKALPIIKPVVAGNQAEDRDKVEDDEFGRPAPSLARSKRARRGLSGSDEEVRFAPQPSDHSEIPGAAEPLAMSSVEDEARSPSPAAIAGAELSEGSEPFAFDDRADAQKFAAAVPLSLRDRPQDSSKSPTLERPVSHSFKPSVEAISNMQMPELLQASPKAQIPKKAVGLEASRYAVVSDARQSPIHLSPLASVDQDVDSEAEISVEPLSPQNVSVESDHEEQSLTHEVEPADQSGDLAFDHGQPDGAGRPELVPSNHVDEPVPSYEEIDAVMRQFEDNPDLGVERLESPVMESTPASEPKLLPKLHIRSDAPSPSPRRAKPIEILDEQEVSETQSFADVNIGHVNRDILRKLDHDGEAVISDWDDVLSSADEERFRDRAPFLDARINGLVDGLLENRIAPLERTLEQIQHSVALIAERPASGQDQRSLQNEAKESDADDEEDEVASRGIGLFRTRSPAVRRDRRPESVKSAVVEALTVFHSQNEQKRDQDLASMHSMLTEMRMLLEQGTHSVQQSDLRAVVEDVIATHPRLRGQRVQQDHEIGGVDERSRLQINGLEIMLKRAEQRAEDEYKLRRNAEDEMAHLQRRLRIAEEEAVQHRESSEQAERTLQAYSNEKHDISNLEDTISQLSLKNAALETTLEEYRLSSDTWRDDIQEERNKNKTLRSTLHHLKRQLEESSESKQALRGKTERLQKEITTVVTDLASEHAARREKEHELWAKAAQLEHDLSHEVRRREEVELELDELDKEHKQNVSFRQMCNGLEKEIERLEAANATLREESKAHENAAFRYERELQHVRESHKNAGDHSKSVLEAGLQVAKTETESVRKQMEGHISRLQHQLQNAQYDATDMKNKHDALLEETLDAHNRALQQAAEDKENALQDQHAAHEKKLNDLRERHTRALHNSSDDRHRLEHNLNEKLSLRDDKIHHLESKITDLEERLEITRSAARAAAQAASGKPSNNLPTPSPSVVASPPHPPSTSASMPLARGIDVPEKISPQALRESIIVLQDQLQNREQTIERLEAELSKVDHDAPAKLKERETEIGWLRELLGVRLDDLEDIIKTLSEPDYNRNSVRDAAIRLRANLQMEQQIRERAASGQTASIFPSGLAALTQSPSRALPLAAAAAWGNWRKARDSSIGALSDFVGSQTPSRSSSTSTGSGAAAPAAQSFLASLMTPPATVAGNLRASAPPTMRPLKDIANAHRATVGERRPLRRHHANARPLVHHEAKESISRPGSGHGPQQKHLVDEEPTTPSPRMRGPGLDGAADGRTIDNDDDEEEEEEEEDENDARSFADDVDDDAGTVVLRRGGDENDLDPLAPQFMADA